MHKRPALHASKLVVVLRVVAARPADGQVEVGVEECVALNPADGGERAGERRRQQPRRAEGEGGGGGGGGDGGGGEG